MDIADTIEAKSDQLNSADLIGGPVIVTVAGVDVVGGDQPVHIHLHEYPGKPYKPSKGMRRALVLLWGKRSSEYAGRRLELFRNPDVLWAGKPAGGIQISGASHINAPVKVPHVIARNKQGVLEVQPLAAAPPAHADPLPVPVFDTLEEARDYYTHRQKAGASPDELHAIAAAAPKTDNNPTAQENK